jgi:putative lipoic acid-binding regulatory protein
MTEDETLLEFPCEFPIKAMGKAVIGLERTVLDLIQRHVPDVSEDSMRIKPSSSGKYISVTVTIIATSKAQLDNIYQDITDHPDILMAL